MRFMPFIAIAAALIFAGCFGSDDEAPPVTTTPTTPADGGNTGGNQTDNGSGDNMTPTPEPAKAPKEAWSASFDFQRPPPQEPTTQTFSITDEGYKTLFLNVTFTPHNAALGANNGAALTLTGPSGAVVGPCSPPATGPQPSESVCEVTGTPEVGEWTASFAGEATWSAAIVVTLA